METTGGGPTVEGRGCLNLHRRYGSLRHSKYPSQGSLPACLPTGTSSLGARRKRNRRPSPVLAGTLLMLASCASIDGNGVGLLPGVGARVYSDEPSVAAKIGATLGLPPISIILNAATVFIPTWMNLAQPASGEPCTTSDHCAFALFGSVALPVTSGNHNGSAATGEPAP